MVTHLADHPARGLEISPCFVVRCAPVKVHSISVLVHCQHNVYQFVYVNIIL